MYCNIINSLILATTKSNYTQFNWDRAAFNMTNRVGALDSNSVKTSKYNPSSIKSKIRLCVAASLLLFSRSQFLNVVQLFVGSILYTGHAAKKVIYIYTSTL